MGAAAETVAVLSGRDSKVRPLDGCTQGARVLDARARTQRLEAHLLSITLHVDETMDAVALLAFLHSLRVGIAPRFAAVARDTHLHSRPRAELGKRHRGQEKEHGGDQLRERRPPRKMWSRVWVWSTAPSLAGMKRTRKKDISILEKEPTPHCARPRSPCARCSVHETRRGSKTKL